MEMFEIEIENRDDKLESYFYNIARDVLNKFEDVPRLDIRIYICENGEYAIKRLSELDIDDRTKAELIDYSEEKIPFSVSDDTSDYVFIFISGDNEYLKWNRSAFSGLLAHEVMHAIQRRAGIEDEIKKGLKRIAGIVKRISEEINMDEGSIEDILRIAILSLKDIFAEKRIISLSFLDDYLEHLYNVVGVKRFCPMPEFGDGEMENLVEKIKFELQMMSIWLPLVNIEHTKAREILKHVETCYEVNLSDIAKRFRILEVLYTTKFSMTSDFVSEFLISVLRVVYQLVMGDMFVVSHITSAINSISEIEIPEKELVINTLLKAVHSFLRKHPEKNDEFKKLETEFRDNLKDRLDEQEFNEWMEIIDEYEKDDLLRLPLYFTVRYAREKELEKIDDESIYEPIYLLADSAYELTSDDFYIELRNFVILELPRVSWNHIEKAKKLLFYEFELHQRIFEESVNGEFARKLVKSFEKFNIEIKNEFIESCLSILKAYDTVKEKENQEELLPVLIRAYGKDEVDLALMARITLLALNLDFGFIDEVVEKVSE